MTTKEWELLTTEIAEAFGTSRILTIGRAELERYLVGLTANANHWTADSRRFEAWISSISHLLAVRLQQEVERSREEAQTRFEQARDAANARAEAGQAIAAAAMRQHNFWTRWISTGALIVAAVGVWVSWWTRATPQTPPPAAPPIQSPAALKPTP